MRITRIIAILLIGLLVIAGACSSPVAPVSPTPIPTPTIPAPAPPTPTTPALVTPPPAPATPKAVQGPYDIWIPGNAYSPTTLTVPVGTKVT
ncbi:MAG: hypothetical protein Q7J73_03610 [Dehalococcoidales bacterium]|nr:hypothetical protein [Dehalococcoidales bacterium]